jgi:hypothetical protein
MTLHLIRVRRLLMSGAALAVSLTSLTSLDIAHASTAASPSNAQPFDVEQAVEFRRDAGLEYSEDAMSAATKANSTSQFLKYGIPLTPTEEARLDAREKMQSDTAPLRTLIREHPDEYASIWTDVATDRVVIDVVQGTSTDAASELIKRAGVSMSKVVFREVARSATEVEAAIDSFMSGPAKDLAAQGVTVSRVGLRVQDSVVEVGIKDLTDSDATTLARRYPGYTFVERRPFVSVDRRDNSGGQWKGGTQILGWDANQGCTASFAIKAPNGNRYMVTAGHCASGLTTSHWDHNWSSQYPMVAQYFLSGSYADIGLIDVPDYMASNTIVLKTDPGGSPYGGQGASIVAAKLWTAVGDTLCRSGKTSGYQCGVVTGIASYNQWDEHVGASMYLKDQVILDFSSWSGDSGSPIMTLGTYANGVQNVSIAGTLSGGCDLDHPLDCSGETGFGQLGNIYYMTLFNFGSMSAILQATAVPVQAGHDGKCLDVKDNSTADGARIQQWDCLGTSNQLFRVLPRYGTYTLQAVNSGKCVDVTGGNTANGALLQQWTCSTPAVLQQRFHFAKTTVDNGAWPDFQLQAQHSGRCVDVKDYSTSNGALIQQFDCVAGGGGPGNQRWKHY